MPDAFKTPGVFVPEIAVVPPAITQVPTAVPAFLGYTEKANGPQPVRIESLRGYEQVFGGPPQAISRVVLTTDAAGATVCRPELAADAPLLYDSLRLYFDNGGGPCHVVPVGRYAAPAALADFDAGLTALQSTDGPTLVVMPDATRLADDDFRVICGHALDHCGLRRDRFAVLDVKRGLTVAAFRQVSSQSLSYGAAYIPYLTTSLPRLYDEGTLDVIFPHGLAAPKKPRGQKLRGLKDTDLPTYTRIKTALDALRLTLPPSGAVAGIYARVDRERGVWKAPANVAPSSVLDVEQDITNDEQAALNVDAAGGKSINAIRRFPGRGVRVWGARTLAGNDPEWRYVAVRRLLMMIEQSVTRGTAFAVFEPNTAGTWLKVRAMTESFLHGLWQRGALAGAKPEEAYFVQVGLGATMTTQDVLQGRLIVLVGVAPMRAAEFIMVRSSHQLTPP